MEEPATYNILQGQRVRVKGREDLGVGEVYRISDSFGLYQAEIAFDDGTTRRLEIFPLERLEPAPDIWQRLQDDDVDRPIDFLLKQLAFQFPLENTGGQLSNSRTHLLPHQILLTRDVVSAKHRRFLIADEVGLGKTIEAGMILRELQARGEAERILIITPAGLIKNWYDEMRDLFRLHFEILGRDFVDHAISSWEIHNMVIASIDTLKRPQRLERLLGAPRWHVIVFDEAHHLSRTQYGRKIQLTQNYRLAESLRNHTRDMLFLSATPHQGNTFQFWSIIQLLDDSLFESEDAMVENRGLLGRVMVRRTKREVTDRHGDPIFMRRQVHTESFQQSAREKIFYDQLTEYLREGYSAAGLGESKTTNEQRAIGFVMTTFQKIMSSSIRAIRQALRRRLLTLLIRQEFDLEGRRKKRPSDHAIGERLLKLRDELREIAALIQGLENGQAQMANLDAYVAQARQRVSRKYVPTEETTEWSLDADEEGDEGIYMSAEIPDEVQRVKSLLSLIPDGVDRKCDTLKRAIDSIRRDNPNEKFVIFTQYVETMLFLNEQLERTYGSGRTAIIRGGPLDDKLAAKERFWEEDGAEFLICTSAGGEGINLQVAHILFNYDLPWNPMAVEQRIGRIHRYGQHDTAQVYNLVAEDTVEEHIYNLLERKLQEIAEQIGKVDPATGEPREDFRSEILGFIGSQPSYLELYKRALVEKDYARTEQEIAEAIEKAREASEALASLTQDLHSFDLQNYLDIEGRFDLADLQRLMEAAILRLGGSILPKGDFLHIITPPIVQRYSNVLPKYELATFDREAAMRKRSAELLGLGHPLIDAIIRHLQDVTYPGDLTLMPLESEEKPYCVFETLITIDLEDGTKHHEFKIIRITSDAKVQIMPEEWVLDWLEKEYNKQPVAKSEVRIDWSAIRQAYDSAIGAIVTQIKLTLDKPLAGRVKLVGVCCVC